MRCCCLYWRFLVVTGQRDNCPRVNVKVEVNVCSPFCPNRKQQLHEDASSGQEAVPHTCTRVRARTSPPIALCHVLDVRWDWSQNTSDVKVRQVKHRKKTTPETVIGLQIKIIFRIDALTTL